MVSRQLHSALLGRGQRPGPCRLINFDRERAHCRRRMTRFVVCKSSATTCCLLRAGIRTSSCVEERFWNEFESFFPLAIFHQNHILPRSTHDECTRESRSFSNWL